MTKYRIDAIGLIGLFTEFNEIELINSAQTFDVNLNLDNVSPETELSLLITEAKSHLGDYIGRDYDFCITRLGKVEKVIKDWSNQESETIFWDCMNEFDEI